MTCDSCIEKKWSERDIAGHTCAHTQRHGYHRSYTSERGQGSVWNWVKETGHVTHRRERKSREKRKKGGREKSKEEVAGWVGGKYTFNYG